MEAATLRIGKKIRPVFSAGPYKEGKGGIEAKVPYGLLSKNNWDHRTDPNTPFLSHNPRTPFALGSAQTVTSKKYYKKITHSALSLAATTKVWYYNTPKEVIL
ncbi:hypothetical protein N9Y59_02850 [Planktomarina temperata]|nr:hypothetical protein [Planktomarina temperata]